MAQFSQNQTGNADRKFVANSNSAIFNSADTMKSSNSVTNPRKDIITFSHGMTNMSDNLLRRTKQGKLFLAKMFLPLLVISLLFTITTTEAKAEPTVIPISIPECAHSIPDCGGWHDWKYFAEEMWFDGYEHDLP